MMNYIWLMMNYIWLMMNLTYTSPAFIVKQSPHRAWHTGSAS